MSEPATSLSSRRARWASSACWCVAAVSTSIAGAIASFIVGAFVGLWFGMAMIAAAGGGTGQRVDRTIFFAMLGLGPMIVGACTFGIATLAGRLPRLPARRASPRALAVSSALTTIGFVATHRPGYIAYVN